MPRLLDIRHLPHSERQRIDHNAHMTNKFMVGINNCVHPAENDGYKIQEKPGVLVVKSTSRLADISQIPGRNYKEMYRIDPRYYDHLLL